MRVNCYLSGNETHDRVIRAFYDGCPAQKKLLTLKEYEPSDIAVIFGVYKSKVPASWLRGAVFQRQRAKNLDVIVLETGYVNRGDGEHHHYAAGFNGLNGRADFRNQNMPDDRVRKLGVELKPWREGGSVVVCGQVPWDASVEGTDHYQWCQATVEKLRDYTDRKIKFRPHPLAATAMKPLWGCETSLVPLAEDLKSAHCVVTFNSNSAVEALIAGVPAFAADRGSMAWDVANKSLLQVDVPNKPDRTQWLNDLTYAQWTPEEMRSGEAWAHLT